MIDDSSSTHSGAARRLTRTLDSSARRRDFNFYDDDDFNDGFNDDFDDDARGGGGDANQRERFNTQRKQQGDARPSIHPPQSHRICIIIFILRGG